MSYTAEQRQKIADEVRRTRVAKRLDKEPAARAAKVSSITWKRVEDGEGVRDASLGKILSSLDLPEVDVLLRGSPTPHRDEPPTGDLPAGPLLHGTLLWNAVVAAADAAVDTELEELTERAVVRASDAIPELVLALNPGPQARGLIEQTVVRGALAVNRVNRKKGQSHELETEAQSDAQAQAIKDEEARRLHEAKIRRTTPLRDKLGTCRVEPARPNLPDASDEAH